MMKISVSQYLIVYKEIINNGRREK